MILKIWDGDLYEAPPRHRRKAFHDFFVGLYDFCRINTIFIRFLYDFSSTIPARRLRFLFPLRGFLGSL